MLGILLKKLHEQKILTEDLAIPEDMEDLELTYRGLCRHGGNGRRRRIGGFLTYLVVRVVTYLFNPRHSGDTLAIPRRSPVILYRKFNFHFDALFPNLIVDCRFF